jgi:uncharacterized protein YndB with AHSA1/START domain
MPQFSEIIDIERPPEDVWRALGTPERAERLVRESKTWTLVDGRSLRASVEPPG